MSKRVLVTGAAGFIGSHLVDALLEDGDWVLGVDSFTEDYASDQKIHNIDQALRHPNFLLCKADLVEANLLWLLQEHQIVLICHLAGQTDTCCNGGTQLEKYVKNDIVATHRILEAALSAGGVPVVYASSASTPGYPPSSPIADEIAPTPTTLSNITKLAAEQLCCFYSTVHDLPTVTLRLSSVYGPRQRPDMTFSRVLNAVKLNQEIVLDGDSSQAQDFAYVGDVIQAFQVAIQFILENRENGKGRVFTVTGKNRVSLLEVLEVMAEITSCRPRVQYCPPLAEDSTDVQRERTDIQQRLNLFPEVDLREGIRRQWFDLWSNEME